MSFEFAAYTAVMVSHGVDMVMYFDKFFFVMDTEYKR